LKALGILAAIAVALAAQGCASHQVLSRGQDVPIEKNFLATMFLPFDGVHLSEDSYWRVPSDEWLWEAWSEFDDVQARAGAGCDLPQYHCHAVALGLLWMAQAKYAKERRSDACGAPAVGEIWYRMSKDGVRHAAIAAVVGPDSELMFFDPRTFSRLFLTPKEAASIEFVRF